MFSQIQKDQFFDAIESLKKYRRADLVDDKGRSLLKELYTDLLPNEHILKKSLQENTTFLIGRKGTGKSTIFLRIEQELRGKKDVLPCYLDVKTIYEAAQTDYQNLDYLSDYLNQKNIKKYLVERSFLQSVLIRILDELDVRYGSTFEKFKELFGNTKAQEIRNRLKSLRDSIEDNENIKEIEIPAIKSIATIQKTFDENTQATSVKHNVSANAKISSDPSLGVNAGSEETLDAGDKQSIEVQESFTNIFLQIFQIKDYIGDIKDILKDIEIKTIVVLLDDFSEIDDVAIRTFVDVVLAPLNNWSENSSSLRLLLIQTEFTTEKLILVK